MEENEKLTMALGILDNYWTKFTSNLSKEQMQNLKQELTELELKIKSAKNNEEVTTASKNFFETLLNIESLEFLANVDKTHMRGGSLPEIQNDIKIKIINYCVTLQDRIDEITDQ
jgi:hypothetical protein